MADDPIRVDLTLAEVRELVDALRIVTLDVHRHGGRPPDALLEGWAKLNEALIRADAPSTPKPGPSGR